MNDPTTAEPRLLFLDWLRILAFGLLVPYHVGMYYVSWDWHVKSAAAGPAIEPLMMLSSPWRLSLLFFIGGAAVQAMLRRQPAGFIGTRSKRLLWPLLFGMFVIVPPQAYYEVVTKVAYSGSYAEFMQLYVRGYGGFCRSTDCLDLPTWNHLWFLPYLWAYGLAAWALHRFAPRLLDTLSTALGRTPPLALLLLPALPLMAARLLVGRFPTTHDLVNDWYNHAQYLSIFLIGLLLARGDGNAWKTLQRLRWPALLLALAAWALWLGYIRTYENASPPEALRFAQRLMFGAMQWWAIAAACGFARRWLASAIFCVYILHQTVIVLLTRALLPLQLPPPIEGVMLIAMTFAICLAGYALARRVPLLRGALGITPRPAASPDKVQRQTVPEASC